MASRERNKTRTLEVRVMFEPSRVAPACVVQAYERVLPMAHRVMPSARTRHQANWDEIQRQVGGVPS